MIAFVFAMLYSVMTLLSPFVLPDAIVRLHAAEIMGILTIAAVAVYVRQAKLASMTETYLAIAIVVTTALSILATGWLGGVPGFVIGFLPIVCNFFFIVLSCRSLLRLRIFTLVLLMVAFFILGHGALALAAGDFTNVYLQPEGTSGGFIYRIRGLGVLNDPNDLAQFFVMMLPLLWLRWSKSLIANTLFTLAPAGLLIYGIYLTHSRGGIVALIGVLLFGFRKKLGLIGSVLTTAIGLSGMLALNMTGNRSITEDDGGRVAAWATGLAVFKTHPLFGVGVGNFGDYNSTGMTAHNSYVLGLAESGFLGYFCWMGMLVCVWMGLQRIASRTALPATADGSPVEAPGPRATRFAWTRALAKQSVVAPDVTSSQAPPPSRFPWLTAPEADVDRTAAEQEEVIFSARVIQISMVGLLTASFFLSRTYSTPLYVLLGMAVALKTLARPPVQIAGALLLRRVGIVVFASILFLYLFVRLRGNG